MLIRTGIAAVDAGIPSLATDGVEIRPSTTNRALTLSTVDEAVFGVRNTAGTGALTVTIEVWGYNLDAARWYPIDTIVVSATVATDTLRASKRIKGLRDYKRLHAR